MNISNDRYMPFGRGRIGQLPAVLLGAVLAAVGLELFLLPNQLAAGGLSGASILTSHLTERQSGLFIALFHLPFLMLGYRKMKIRWFLMSAIGVGVLAVTAFFLHPVPGVVEQPLVASIFGGAALGAGIGLVFQSGGCLDRPMHIRPIASDKPVYAVIAGWCVNASVLAAVGYLFGIDQALYSIIAYYAAYRSVSLSFSFGGRHRTVWIRTGQRDRMCKALREAMEDVRVVRLDTSDHPEHYSGEQLVCATMDRSDVHRAKQIIRSVDNGAAVWIESVEK